MQSIIDQLESAYRSSIPWESPARFQISDRIFIPKLNIEKAIRGVMFEDNLWHFLFSHHGEVRKIPEFQVQQGLNRNRVIFPNPRYSLGDVVKLPFYNLDKALIVGMVYHMSWQYYFNIEPNKYPLTFTEGYLKQWN